MAIGLVGEVKKALDFDINVWGDHTIHGLIHAMFSSYIGDHSRNLVFRIDITYTTMAVKSTGLADQLSWLATIFPNAIVNIKRT